MSREAKFIYSPVMCALNSSIRVLFAWSQYPNHKSFPDTTILKARCLSLLALKQISLSKYKFSSTEYIIYGRRPLEGERRCLFLAPRQLWICLAVREQLPYRQVSRATITHAHSDRSLPINKKMSAN